VLFHGHVQVDLAFDPVSQLKSIDGPCAEVTQRFGDDPRCGHIFVFLNRARTGAKFLYWDQGGFLVVYKRLERRHSNFRPWGQAGTIVWSRRLMTIGVPTKRLKFPPDPHRCGAG
jgi:hypothetical protein